MKWNEFDNVVVIESLHHPASKEEKIHYSKRLMYKDGNTDPMLTLNKYIPQKNDKLFFSPSCIAPRHKVREWGKKNDIKITIKLEKATANFVSNKWFFNIFDWYISCYATVINADNMIKFIELNYPDEKGIIKEIINSGKENILLRNSYGSTQTMIGDKDTYGSNNLTQIKKDEKGIVKTFCEMFGTGIMNNKLKSSRSVVAENKVSELRRCLKETENIPLYTDTSLLDYLTEDCVTINDEMYIQLRNMFGSRDHANYVIGMEILANCNYRTSILKILLTLKDYGHVMYGTKERTHVNFKSFIKFLDVRDWTRLTFDDIIKCMMDKKYLTGKFLKEMMPLVKKEMENNSNGRYDNFTIKTITVSDDIKSYFGAQIEEKNN